MRVLQRLCLVVFVILPGLPLSVCAGPPSTYSAEAIEARVVDEDTGQPLEGVIVVANWELMGGLHPGEVGSLMLMETTTNADGRFVFSAWGPKPRPFGQYLHTNDPLLLFFKSGYHFQGLQNPLRSKVDQSSVRRSVWNGQTIKLKKFAGSLEQYAEHVGHLDDELKFAFRYHDCSWKQIPRMLVAMHLENKRFTKQGLRNSSYYPSSIENREEEMSPTEAAKCGSIQEFLRSYLP